MWREVCDAQRVNLVDAKRNGDEKWMMISWSPPPLGWLKVNSYGALELEVETAMATSGGAIRDYRGQWLVGFERNIGHATVTVTDAELWGCSSLKKKRVYCD